MDHLHLQLAAVYANERRRETEQYRLARIVRPSRSAAPRRSWRLGLLGRRVAAPAA